MPASTQLTVIGIFWDELSTLVWEFCPGPESYFDYMEIYL